jgi:AraC-like DNA-binding protein
MAGRQVFELLGQMVPFSQGVVVSTLPRGSIHVVQPNRCPESFVKAYERANHAEDRLVWQAILKGQSVRASDVWSANDFESSPYLHSLLAPHGLRYAVAVPLSAPIFNGYPGAVLLMRGPEGEGMGGAVDGQVGDFTDAELAKLKNVGKEVDDFIAKGRQQRNNDIAMNTDPWTHGAPVRVFVFGKDAKPIFPAPNKSNSKGADKWAEKWESKGSLNLDTRVEEELVKHAKAALEATKRGQEYTDRLLLPDERGDHWVFHVSVCKDYPALGGGPVVFFMLQPESYEWTNVKTTDLAAHDEMTRLLPTLKFMQQEYANNPTLNDIAKKAHLSPFHFHRRFTELMGQTPKHFLLSCQIHDAKRALVARRRQLAQIATDCGFAHQSHFTSRFKQATGLTPTRWRRMAAEIVHGKKLMAELATMNKK